MTWKGWETYAPEVQRLRDLATTPRRAKYGNRPQWVLASGAIVEATTTMGHPPKGALWFASLKEAQRFVALAREHEAGRIHDLVVQPRFPLTAVTPSGVRVGVGEWIGDFQYVRDGHVIVEDVKGIRTPAYRLKKKLAEVEHGIRIEEV